MARLCHELRDRRYTGSGALVDGYAACLRTGIPPPGRSPPEAVAAPPTQPPAPRQVVWLLLRPRNAVAETERQCLGHVRQACPVLAAAVDLAGEFVEVVRGRRPDRLDAWLRAASTSGIAEFQTLARGLDHDRAAVAAALAERWSNGQTEGQALRLKPIKRQGDGRAKFDLPRKRVPRAA